MQKLLLLLRQTHVLVGIFSAVTLGIIAISCFPIAHEWKGFGKTLADIHMGKFLPKDLRWIWIDSQGLFLALLVVSGWMIHRSPARRARKRFDRGVGEGGVLILYGTQTGNARTVAERLLKRLLAAGCPARVAEMAEHGFIDLSKEQRLAVVLSTTGDGEFPDSSRAFWTSLNREALPLDHLQFCVLGLGDSTYPKYCEAAIQMDARLAAMSAKRVLPLCKVEPDFERAARKWIDEVQAVWGAGGDKKEGNSVEVITPVSSGIAPKTTKVLTKEQASGRLLLNQRLTLPGSTKETRHFEISIDPTEVSYQPGDVLGIQPRNCHGLVDLTLTALHADGEEGVSLPNGETVSLRKALLENYELSKISLDLVEAVAARAPESDIARIAGDDASLKEWKSGREVVDLLLHLNGTPLDPQTFVDSLCPLKPRLYSIASSPLRAPDRVDLTVSVVRYQTHGFDRKGVCSTFLADRARHFTPFEVFLEQKEGFRLPKNPDCPIIMIGPGTGVAPFRSFLQHREATGAKGKNWLFFGEQRGQTDHLYQEEMAEFTKRGVLTRLDCAFSRDQREKCYVQDKMRAAGPEVWQWIDEGAVIYICGDARRMAPDVTNCLGEIGEKFGGKSSKEWVSELKESGRLLLDVY